MSNRSRYYFGTLLCRALVGALVIGAVVAGPVVADDGADDPNAGHLFGSWGGARERLESRGIAVESVLTNDFVANVSGGVQKDQALLGNFDLTATFDTEKMGLWSGGSFFAYVLGNYGDEPGRFIGDLQGTDNIQAYSTAKLYEFWYEHKFANERVAVLIGLHDYNSEFDSLDYAGELINSSFGISVDGSQVGPSIFPTTSLAARIRVRPFDTGYIQTALYDGVPGDPNNPQGTQIILKHDDGLFWGNELGLVSQEDAEPADHFKIAGGYWLQTTDFEDFAGVTRSVNSGFYAIGEKGLWSETDAAQGLGAFVQAGFARSDRNTIRNYIGGGLRYVGLLPKRNEDVFSVAYNRAHAGDAYRELSGSESSESVFELTYRMAIMPYLTLQPDIQFVHNPGLDASLDDAVVITTRVEVAL